VYVPWNHGQTNKEGGAGKDLNAINRWRGIGNSKLASDPQITVIESNAINATLVRIIKCRAGEWPWYGSNA
jgi:hypothetical protein